MSRAYKIPDLKFEDQNLTSFAGLIIFQPLMLGLEIKNRLYHCFRHLKASRIFGHHIITMLLIVHLLLGYRRLRDLSYYQDDPMVKRLLGLNQLPDPSTVSRALSSIDGMSIERVRELCRKLVIERLKKIAIYRLTLDFDGSVLATLSRTTEGTAVGYNRSKREPAVIIPYSVPSPKRGRSSMSIIGRAMSTTLMGPGNLSWPVSPL